MCFYVSLAAVVFNYYVLGLFGQSFTLGCSLWLKSQHLIYHQLDVFLVVYYEYFLGNVFIARECAKADLF